MFRTYEPTRDRLVAVKVFRLDITPEQAQLLADELARAAEASLFHPSIVEPIASGLEGTLAYRAEEYVAAESLDAAMRHYAPASLDKALPFITQLASAIDFARDAGIGHGALHPRDIFVTPDEARATGFGVVDALERVGLRAPVRRPYTAPERVASESWSTPADVFSLAAIAFELLTGRRPSGLGEDIGSLTGAASTEHLGAIRTVLVRAMNEDPHRRYQTAGGLAFALEAAARQGMAEVGGILAIDDHDGIDAIDESDRIDAIDGSDRIGGTDAIFADESGSREDDIAGRRDDGEAEEIDDISAERDEDEAHWRLTKEETAAADPAETGDTPLFKDEAVAAAGERLVFEAADLAIREPESKPTFFEEFRRPESSARFPDSATARIADDDMTTSGSEREVPPSRPAYGRQAPPSAPPPMEDDVLRGEGTEGAEHVPLEGYGAAAERARPPVLPLAVVLILGLLIGFAGGHFVGKRSGYEEALLNTRAGEIENPGSTVLRPEGTTSSPQPAPSAQPSPTAPPAVPPGVPPDAPAEPRSAAARERTPPAAPRSGRLVVRSTPSGANVTVNGTWRGRTPLPLDNLALDEYSVRVVLQGHETVTERVRLSSAESSRTVSVQLKPIRSQAAAAKPTPPASVPATASSVTGSVYVDSRPRGARVLLDGKPVGTTPIRIPEVGAGSHVIRLELAEYQPWTNSLRVTSGQEARVTGSLEPIR